MASSLYTELLVRRLDRVLLYIARKFVFTHPPLASYALQSACCYQGKICNDLAYVSKIIVFDHTDKHGLDVHPSLTFGRL